MCESIYNEWINVSKARSLIIGPCFVPSYWNVFLNKNIWKEKRFREIITTIKVWQYILIGLKNIYLQDQIPQF